MSIPQILRAILLSRRPAHPTKHDVVKIGRANGHAAQRSDRTVLMDAGGLLSIVGRIG